MPFSANLLSLYMNTPKIQKGLIHIFTFLKELFSNTYMRQINSTGYFIRLIEIKDKPTDVDNIYCLEIVSALVGLPSIIIARYKNNKIKVVTKDEILFKEIILIVRAFDVIYQSIKKDTSLSESVENEILELLNITPEDVVEFENTLNYFNMEAENI